MSLNVSKIKEQLAAAKKAVKKTSSNTSRSRELVWKPEEGEQTVRIVPRPEEPDNPFIKLLFHYQFNGPEGKPVTYFSPANIDKKDPVIELSERLKASGDRKLWGKGKSLEPKARTYVPVVVRGKEHEGIKYWGFGVTIFEQLVAAIDELDLAGETITDLNNGYDIKVIFTPAEKSNKTSPDGRKFPDTAITVKRKSSPVIDPANPKAKEIMEKITSKQPVLAEAWECPDYNVLAKALEDYLKKNEKGRAVAAGEVVEKEETVILPTEEEIANAVSSTPTNLVSPSAKQAVENVKPPTAQPNEMEAVLEELFNGTSK